MPALAAALAWATALAVAALAPGARASSLALLPDIVGASELTATAGRTGLALGGWDPVSYRTDPAPRPGEPRFEAVWRGVVWRFAGAANRAAFLGDPDAFAPRLGGYDAAAMATGAVADADPRVFAVTGEGLYLFRIAAERDAFLRDRLAGQAEDAWPRLRAGLVGG